MIITNKKHNKIIGKIKAEHKQEIETKDIIIMHKNNEIHDLAKTYETERDNSNSYFEANKKLLQELHKLRKDYKSLKRKHDRLQSKNKHKGDK